MTIFFSIAKDMLKEIIKARQESAKNKDQSRTNSMAQSIGLGRKFELSTYKQGLLEELTKALDTFVEEKNDETTKNTLYNLFEKYRILAKEKAHKCDVHNEGKFGPTMENCQIIINKLFSRLNEVKLNDKILDKDPLSLFRYYAAKYFSEKISQLPTPKQEKNRSLFGSLGNKVKKITKQVITEKIAPVNVSHKKEQLLLKTLALCENQLGQFDIHRENYVLNRKQRVLETVCGILDDNKKLVDKHSTTKIPVSITGVITVSFDGIRIGPSEGKLYGYLCKLCFELKEQISEYKKNHSNIVSMEKNLQSLRLSQNIPENQPITHNILQDKDDKNALDDRDNLEDSVNLHVNENNESPSNNTNMFF